MVTKKVPKYSTLRRGWRSTSRLRLSARPSIYPSVRRSICSSLRPAVRHHRPPLLVLMIIPPLPTSCCLPLKSRQAGTTRRRRLAAGSTTAPVDAAAAVHRHVDDDNPTFAPATTAIFGFVFDRRLMKLIRAGGIPLMLLLPSTATVRYCCCR